MDSPSANRRPAIVCDIGSGFSKIGFAGNSQPSLCIPTAVAARKYAGQGPAGTDCCIGQEAVNQAGTGSVVYPMRCGVVEDWDSMELFWQQSLFQFLRVDPEDHHFVLTEPAINPLESKEQMAEIMFETFGVAGLYIGAEPVLSLYTSNAICDEVGGAQGRPLTGIVVECGYDTTYVVPVVDGYVLGSSIHRASVGGSHVSQYVQQLLRESGESLPTDCALDVATQIKESHCYTCADTAKEFARYSQQPQKYRKVFNMAHPRTGKEYGINVDQARFLGPELYFSPSISPLAMRTPLPQVIDSVVQSCPIDTRRALYSNVVLSGGSSMIRNFGRRIQQDLEMRTAARLDVGAKPIQVNVMSHKLQHCAAWFGGSLFASAPDFHRACRTREQYQECGPSFCRGNVAVKGT